MQILIDIPNEKSEKLIRQMKLDRNFRECKIIELPKGHGKIIDYGYVVDAIDDWVNAEEYRYTNATDYLRKRVANIPTIIEADKESENA